MLLIKELRIKRLKYMLKINKWFVGAGILITCFNTQAQSEPVLVDEVLAVVGKNAIFKSEIEASIEQLKLQGAPSDFSTSCYVLQEKLFEKLLIHKAEVDSVEISDQEIDEAINRRMDYMLMRLGGSEDDFMKYYGKSVLQFKKDIRGTVADNILGQKVRGRITGEVMISPSEVIEFFNGIAKDSLPTVPESYKMAQLVVKAKASEYEKARRFIKASIDLDAQAAGAEVLEHLGDVYEKLENFEEAQKMWKQALEKDTTRTHLKEKIEE